MLTATEWTTGATIIVKPIAIRRPNDAYDMLLIMDETTGKGIWFTNDGGWHIDLQGVDGNPLYDAEKPEGGISSKPDVNKPRTTVPQAYEHGLRGCFRLIRFIMTRPPHMTGHHWTSWVPASPRPPASQRHHTLRTSRTTHPPSAKTGIKRTMPDMQNDGICPSMSALPASTGRHPLMPRQ